MKRRSFIKSLLLGLAGLPLVKRLKAKHKWHDLGRGWHYIEPRFISPDNFEIEQKKVQAAFRDFEESLQLSRQIRMKGE